MTWLLNTRFGRWLAAIGGALAILAAAVFAGWSKRGQKETARKAQDYADTRKRVDDADFISSDSDDDLRSKLHERGKRKP